MNAAAIVLVAALAQAPTAPPQTFRSGAQIVEVDVRVYQGGHFVTDLTADDFTVTENGVAQPIRTLSLVRGPTLAAPAPSSPAEPQTAAAGPRQTWLFFFDTGHLNMLFAEANQGCGGGVRRDALPPGGPRRCPGRRPDGQQPPVVGSRRTGQGDQRDQGHR